jgi:hypothetical protein
MNLQLGVFVVPKKSIVFETCPSWGVNREAVRTRMGILSYLTNRTLNGNNRGDKKLVRTLKINLFKADFYGEIR